MIDAGATLRLPKPTLAGSATRERRSGPATNAEQLVASLSLQDYELAIAKLASFGDRRRDSAGFDAAAEWIEAELVQAGYAVERHAYEGIDPELGGGPRRYENIYATRVGTTAPDEMLIVSAHLDGIGNGGAADDDASGSALVRENRRVAEIGRGSNPHWHRSTDVYETYSEADFRLGFNAVQMTVGTVARLAGDAGSAVAGDE